MEYKLGNDYLQERTDMVEYHLKGRGIKDEKTLAAFLKVPRHKFIPKKFKKYSYYDGPLPIGEDQTISQPYIVALMTELLNLRPGNKVLEIGTGSGYQTAILCELGCEVYTIEIIKSLSNKAKKLLHDLGYKNVYFKIADGYEGWQEKSPFDAILVSAYAATIPKPLIDQLKVGGRMVIPLEDKYQELTLINKKKDGISKEKIAPVRFVPMTGEAQKHM